MHYDKSYELDDYIVRMFTKKYETKDSSYYKLYTIFSSECLFKNKNIEIFYKLNLPKSNFLDLANIMDGMNNKPHERIDLCSDENYQAYYSKRY